MLLLLQLRYDEEAGFGQETKTYGGAYLDSRQKLLLVPLLRSDS